MSEKLVSSNIPSELAKLAKVSKKELVEKLTEKPFKNAIINVMQGKNIREFTESLTRARLLRSYSALMQLYINNIDEENNFNSLLDKTKNSLKNKKGLTVNEYACIQWLAGLTSKLSQNVLRDNIGEGLDEYVDNFVDNINIVSEESTKSIGKMTATIVIENEKGKKSLSLDWSDLLFILSSVGSQTLTIRGSEKSLHGKNFEKLMLGSVFQILGLTLTTEEQFKKKSIAAAFWLSSEDNGQREADATIVKDNKGIRIDIGFIGRGNTEITLDKVSRYQRNTEINGKKYEMDTIIIVDRIGTKSKVDGMAEKIQGNILRMSDANWVSSLSKLLKEKLNVDTGFHKIKDLEGMNAEIKKRMKKINISALIS